MPPGARCAAAFIRIEYERRNSMANINEQIAKSDLCAKPAGAFIKNNTDFVHPGRSIRSDEDLAAIELPPVTGGEQRFLDTHARVLEHYRPRRPHGPVRT
jgi:hypothetical protein